MFSMGLVIMSHYNKRKNELIKKFRYNPKIKNYKLRLLLMDKSLKRKHLNVQD